MQAHINLSELNTTQDIRRLEQALEELYDLHDATYETADPNGSLVSHRGKIAIFNDGTRNIVKINTDGDDTWEELSELLTGDWILSSVTTAHPGWTNVSATYANKFMRINATPLSTGGADTHTHAAGTFASPTSGSHTLTTDEIPAHTHDLSYNTAGSGGTSPAKSEYNTTPQTFTTSSIGGGGGHSHTGGPITGTSEIGDNVPAFITVCIFQKS